MLSKDTREQIGKLAVEAITGKTAAKKPFPDRANLAVRKLIREAIREEGFIYDCKLNETQVNTAARAIFEGAVDFELGPRAGIEAVKQAKKPAPKKAKAGTELDLMKQAAAKAGKKIGKTKKAAAFIIGALLLFGGADRISAQCPGGNCTRAGYTYQTPGAYFNPWAWGGWGNYWTGYYYQQPKPAEAKEDAEPAETEPAPEPAAEADTEPAPENIAPEPEDPEPEQPAAITLAPCPLAALAIDAVNAARRARGLNELTADPELSAACERHSAYMKARGFQHAAGAGRECIAENFATPAATVNAWLASSGHAAILLGPGTRIGIGVVGRYYTLRIR